MYTIRRENIFLVILKTKTQQLVRQFIYPFLPKRTNYFSLTKISILELVGIMENFYERRVYESADYWYLIGCFSKIAGKNSSGHRGLMVCFRLYTQ